VEFAILVPVFLLFLFGITDLGHAWYMKQEIITASREGARYATRYQTATGSGVHIMPNALNPSVVNWVTTNYGPRLPADADLQVTPGGPGFTSGLAGADITVTVTATKRWFVLGHLIRSLGNSQTLTATTIMKVE
jgi:Flp pilus assembly protein TadG